MGFFITFKLWIDNAASRILHSFDIKIKIDINSICIFLINCDLEIGLLDCKINHILVKSKPTSQVRTGYHYLTWISIMDSGITRHRSNRAKLEMSKNEGLHENSFAQLLRFFKFVHLLFIRFDTRNGAA